jgi:hypothetical protein
LKVSRNRITFHLEDGFGEEDQVCDTGGATHSAGEAARFRENTRTTEECEEAPGKHTIGEIQPSDPGNPSHRSSISLKLVFAPFVSLSLCCDHLDFSAFFGGSISC